MKLSVFSIAVLFVSRFAAAAAVTTYADIPYRGRADSPFYSDIHSGRVLVEDFEEFAVTTPGLILPTGDIRSNESPDEDDGKMDLNGFGASWGGPSKNNPSPWPHEIRFEKDAYGNYPTEAGLVLLGYLSGGQAVRRVRAYDAEGVLLTIDPLEGRVPVIDFNPPQDFFIGGDRFYGFSSDRGISRIELGGFVDGFDHVQFGYPVPEPSAVLVAGLAGAALLLRRDAGERRAQK